MALESQSSTSSSSSDSASLVEKSALLAWAMSPAEFLYLTWRFEGALVR
jgi:hypothetical protein